MSVSKKAPSRRASGQVGSAAEAGHGLPVTMCDVKRASDFRRVYGERVDQILQGVTVKATA